jgi:hypothetical protein
MNKVTLGQVLFRVPRFPLPIFIPSPNLGLVQHASSSCSTKCTQFHTTKSNDDDDDDDDDDDNNNNIFI